MHRSLLCLATLGALAATSSTSSAQCVAPTGVRTLQTVFAGTTFYASPNPPDYGVSMDPGTAVRFDLTCDAAIEIGAIGVNLLDDGVTYSTVPIPNLVGAPNGTLEFWFVPNDTVDNAVLFTGNAYSHSPAVPPIAPWQQANPGNVGNLVFAPPNTASMATFTPPIQLGAGHYAVVLVLVPSGADLVSDRIHPLFTDTDSVPTPLFVDDGFVRIDKGGIQSPAFAATALQYNGTPPYVPNVRIDYALAGDTAYATPYGSGCYDRKQTFYESFQAVGTPGGASIDLAPGGLHLFHTGDRYLVASSGDGFPYGGITPGSTSYYSGLGPSTPTRVNAGAPATSMWGNWDDAASVAYPLPFAFAHPGDAGTPATAVIIGSNGAIWLGSTQPTAPRFLGDYSGWLHGPPSFAVAYCDLYPADGNLFQGGIGDIFIDSDGASWVSIAWVGVTEYPSGIVTGTDNDFQITLHSGGDVELLWGHVAHAHSDLLVGFTPGNGAADPGTGPTPIGAPDLSVATGGTGYVSGDGAVPATIRLASRPQVGRALQIITDDVDPAVGANITVVSLGPLPGTDLGFLGMPGCTAWVDPNKVAALMQIGQGPFQWNALASIPPAFAGFDLYAQSVQFGTALPGFNSANLRTSDAVCMHFDRN